jgi:hypothetical protein
MLTRLLSTAALAAVLASPAAAEALTAFDVAEDLTRFVYAETPRFDDGMPAYGNAFVTQGYIYPAGTLDGGIEGTLPDGRPAFPEKVIGVWTCDGYFVGEGMRTKTGTFVVSRQVFQFFGEGLLVTDGPEIVNPGQAVERAIVGGTGEYAEAGPEIVQVMLGMTDGYGARLQFRLSDTREARGPDSEWETDWVR